MRIPVDEMQLGEVWRLCFSVRHIIPGRDINEGILRRVIERNIGRMRKLDLCCVSPVEAGFFSVTVKVVENPVKVAAVVAIILASGVAAGFLRISFVGSERISAAIAPAAGMGVIIIAAAIAIMILSFRKVKSGKSSL